MRPSDIGYSQDSIATRFGKSTAHSHLRIGDTLDQILSGKCRISDIPTITVSWRGDQYYTADNRRLWIFRKLEELGECDEIPVRIGYIIPTKFTTNCSGRTISVRGSPGGILWMTWRKKTQTLRGLSNVIQKSSVPRKLLSEDPTQYGQSVCHTILQNHDEIASIPSATTHLSYRRPVDHNFTSYSTPSRYSSAMSPLTYPFINGLSVDGSRMLKPSQILYSKYHIKCKYGAYSFGEIMDNILEKGKIPFKDLEVHLYRGRYYAVDNSVLWLLKLAEHYGNCDTFKCTWSYKFTSFGELLQNGENIVVTGRSQMEIMGRTITDKTVTGTMNENEKGVANESEIYLRRNLFSNIFSISDKYVVVLIDQTGMRFIYGNVL